MCNGAAHLVDHVIPDVPVRQWVLSVPFELRLLLACRADAFGAITSLFVSEVFRWQRERARIDQNPLRSADDAASLRIVTKSQYAPTRCIP